MDWQLIARVVCPTIGSLIAFIKWSLPKKWYDKRTLEHKRLRLLVNTLFVLMALGTTVIYVSDYRKVEEQTHSLDQLTSKVDSLVTLVTPFEEIAKNLYPDSSTTWGLSYLAQEIKAGFGETAALIRKSEDRTVEEAHKAVERTLYKADASKRQNLSDSLRSLLHTAGWTITNVEIYCQEGDRERLRLTMDIATAFRDAGYYVPDVTNFTALGRSGTGAVECTYNPTQSRSALSVLQALFVWMDFTPDTIPIHSFDSTTLKIEVFGNPFTDADGGLSLR